jgi:hypothetical protein
VATAASPCGGGPVWRGDPGRLSLNPVFGDPHVSLASFSASSLDKKGPINPSSFLMSSRQWIERATMLGNERGRYATFFFRSAKSE